MSKKIGAGRLNKKALGACVLIVCVILFAVLLSNTQKAYTKTVFAMDTYMTLTAYGWKAEAALEAAEQEIYRLDAMLSTGKTDSEVSRLNQTEAGTVTEEIAYLWEKSKRIYDITNGAFDVTIYPVMRAWGFAGGEFRVPEEAELKDLTNLVSCNEVIWRPETKELILSQGMALDFGGIAKGYTGARLSEILKENGVKSALLNLGGNVQLLGNKPDRSAYRIAVKSPVSDEDYLGILTLSDAAVVTSGGYERYFQEDGITYHHIIDPKTGYPARNGLKSVTIVCKDGTLADGYSTALFVMGTEEAIKFCKENEGQFEAVLMTDEDVLYITEGLKNCFETDYACEVIRLENE